MTHSPGPFRVSVFLVLLLLSSLVAIPQPSGAATASLYFSPDTASKTVGDTVTVTMKVNTGGVAINAAEATLSFSTSVLQVKSISRSGSVFSLWPVEPTYSNANGTVNFSGGKPSPGYTGSGGSLFSIVFTAKAAGTARLTISGAQVLANDGLGTNIVGAVGSGSVKVSAAVIPPPTPSTPEPVITSITNPNQDAWSSNSTISASWSGGSGVLGYNAVFDRSPGTDAPQIDEGTTHVFSRSAVEDGVWYLHVRAHYTAGWSGTRHYRFQIDHTAPGAFVVSLARDPVKQGTVTLTFATTDATSGLDHYEMKVDDGSYAVVTSPKVLEGLLPGHHTIVVHALDRAKNFSEASTAFEVSGPAAPTVTFDVGTNRIPFNQSTVPTVIAGQTLRLRGYARKTDTIHVIVRSTESVFDFPVDEHIDPAPVEPAPADMTAWIIEFSPTLTDGDHEIRVSVRSAEGQASAEAPVIRFRVISGAVRAGQYIFPLSTVVRVQFIVLLVLLLIIVALLVWIWHDRRTMHRVKGSVDRRIEHEVSRQVAELEQRLTGGKSRQPRSRK